MKGVRVQRSRRNKNIEQKVTPHYVQVSGTGGITFSTGSSVAAAPGTTSTADDKREDELSLKSLWEQLPSSGYKTPFVLIGLRLEEGPANYNADEAARWLTSTPIPAQCCKVVGMYDCGSTLLLLELPTDLWASLPPSMASDFISYVYSPNLIST
jgi:hypothetical protein